MTTINGTSGNDILSASSGGDFVDAGAGNDQVTLVSNSTADGGSGDDLLVVDLHAVTDPLLSQFEDGTVGFVNDFAPIPAQTLARGQYFERVHLTTGSGNDSSTFYLTATSSIWGADSWDAGGGTDSLDLDISGISGNITAGFINANTYQVTQDGAGPPILITATNVENINITAHIYVNGTTNTFSGGAGNDTLISDADHSFLSGGDGNDVLRGHGGTLDGGNGFDIAQAGYSPGYILGPGYLPQYAETVTFNNDGTITLTDNSGVTLLENIEMVRMNQTNVLMGSLGDDSVTIAQGQNMYMGGPGNDTVTVNANSGTTIIDGGDGNDTVLFPSIASYTIGINEWGDITVSSTYQTTLVNIETVMINGALAHFGSNGNDSLTGTGGNDVLAGLGGNDTLDGGGGNDTAALPWSYLTYAITFNLDGSLTVSALGETDTLRNIENLSFSDKSLVLGTVGDDSIVWAGNVNGQPAGFIGGPGNDTVTLTTGQVFFDGGPGTDTVIIPLDYFNIAPSLNGGDTILGPATLKNVEIVQYNNAIATLSNGQLSFTAAQPNLINIPSTVLISNAGQATPLAPGMSLSNPGGSLITGAVVKIATGFVAGDLLTVNLANTSINASYNSATGTLALSGSDSAAHYQQALRSVQLIAEATLDNFPLPGSVTWQVTNSDASHNVSPLLTTQLSLPISIPSIAQSNEATFISGVQPNAAIASPSFWTWKNDAPAHYEPQHSNAGKWGANTAGTPGGTVSYYFDTASNWTGVEQAMIGAGLALWSAVANISFAVTTNPSGAGITFVRGLDGGAYTSSHFAPGDSNVGQIGSSDLSQVASMVISIDTGASAFGPIGNLTVNGGFGVNTVLHEEGHALGLGHAGPYNNGVAGDNYDASQQGSYDSQLWSLMSYLDPADPYARFYGSYQIRGSNWGSNFPTTPMALDILAAQLLYGAPVNSPLSGGQVFGFNTNITGVIRPFFDFTQNTHPVVTLWDSGANNTLDLSGFSTGSTVNLNPGTASSCDGMINNILIPLKTKIDSFVGGSGDDVITGNNDGDNLFGGAGNDSFTGGYGNDTMDGGRGVDRAIYSGNYADYAITKNPNGTVGVVGAQGTDTLKSIEKLVFVDRTIAWPAAPADFGSYGQSDLVWQNISGQPVVWMMNGATVLDQVAVGSNPGPTWHVKGTGDFDGDGNSDILWQNDNGQAVIWLMNGTAVLDGLAVGGNPGPSWHAVATGDFDGDGKSDLLWQNDNGQAALWLMNGSTVAGGGSVSGNPGPSWHVKGAGDFNGDGKSDILWQSDSGQAAIWFMNGSSVIGGGAAGASPGADWHVVGAGDFNADGKADILWQNDSGQAAVWLMNGSTVIGGGGIGANPGASWHIKGSADFNGDGMSDILWQNDNGQAMSWIMNGTAVSGSALLGSNPGPNWQIANYGAVARKVRNDFDGDRKADILWQGDSGQAAVWLLNGSGSVIGGGAVSPNPGPTWHVKGNGDFDGDGKTDILWQNDNGQAAVWLMNGSTLVGGGAIGNSPSPSWHVVTARDFDGDGKADILWQNDSGQVAMWFMNGASLTGAAVLSTSPDPSWHIKGTGDFDGDGKSDILWQNDNGQAAVWLMNGATIAGAATVRSSPGTSWNVMGAGDFNGDGKSDILWQNDNGQAHIWLMNGTTATSTVDAGSNPGASWHVKGTSDLNGDGLSDILWQNDNGQAMGWMMSGTSVLSTTNLGSNPGPTWHLIAMGG